MIGSTAQEETLFGVEVESRPLPFEHSQPLLPDVMRFLTSAASSLGRVVARVQEVKTMDDIVALLGQLDAVTMAELMGLIVKHEKKLLATTIITMPGPTGELERHELSNGKHRAFVFEQRPDLFVPLCVFAGRVTFTRFFPAGVLPGAAPAAE